MIDESLIKKLNQLSEEFLITKNSSLIESIEYFFQKLTYQTWDTKYKLLLIENPDKQFFSNEMKIFRAAFSSDNAFTKYHLIIPLLIYLFVNHNIRKPALETSLNFMFQSKDHLRPGDFAKTKTGVQRFITNTRFASLELRNLGLLRSDKKHFFKYWSLSPFGILVAAQLYTDFRNHYNLDYFRDQNWAVASIISRNILLSYTSKVSSKEIISQLFSAILEDEVISEHFDLASEKFFVFEKVIKSVLEEGYNTKKQNTKNLVEFINSVNSDNELSKFADSIILKKDIDINMSVVFNILSIFET
ncbi:MAG: hypothetical protein K9J16_00030 [Melioribacteraceae bacterium]|nr:hypothetical protein [Melioribacteraceae bacterium]MCF8353896.1 hypothetical protein [Melioribacteraceae bacterium]MCF8392653.1 hypothetical protein [Melioribacteraceae bacterium]MCF8417674.1 hypothetical protein [Melioribacteraceae bacterium]